ncbi:MAG: ATP-binding protein [Bacteroidales bacterium]|nr:ATP-binding protein [Bacteroidales bacterium]
MGWIYRYGAVIVMLYLFCVNCWASDYMQLKFDRISTSEGLPHQQVNDIFQDELGFMWFCTRGGICRFDGITMKSYSYHKEKPEYGLSHHRVNTGFSLSGNKIWFGVADGLNLYNPEKETFTVVNPLDTVIILARQGVTSIFKDSKGELWFGSHHGMAKLDSVGEEKKLVLKYLFTSERAYGQINLFDIEEDRFGTLWIASDIGLFWYRRSDQTFHKLKNPESHIIYCLLKDRDGIMWLGHNGGLLRMYHSENVEDTRLVSVNQMEGFSGIVPKDAIGAIAEDESGALWLGTNNRGIVIVQRYKNKGKERGRYFNYRFDPYDKYSISSGRVYDIFVDKSGIVWIATSSGISKFDRHKYRFNLYQQNIFDNSTRGLKRIFDIKEDFQKNMWIGTESSYPIVFDRKNLKFKVLEDNDVYALRDFAIINKNLLFAVDGFIGGGLKKIEINDNYEIQNIQSYFSEDKTVLNDDFASRGMVVFKDSDDEIWYGSWEGGVIRFDFKGDFNNSPKITRYMANSIEGLYSNIVTSIIEDKDGKIWLGTRGEGISVFDKKTGKLKNYQSDAVDGSGLSSNKVYCIHRDFKDKIWVGTAHGLNLFNSAVDSFKVYKDTDGLPVNIIQSVESDQYNNLWISTVKGLVRYDMNNQKFITYSPSNGLQNYHFNINASGKDSDGNLYFGGLDGFNSLNPASFADVFNYKPNVVITDILIKNQPLSMVNNKDGVLNKSISYSDEIIIGPEQNFFTLKFAALSYSSPERNKYAYKLEGFDEDWIYTDAVNAQVTFSNLDGGKYVFKVKGANSDLVWNDTPVELKIRVVPPFVKSWSFRILFIVFLTGIIIGYYNYRMILNKKQRLLLENTVDERTRELKQKNQLLIEQSEKLQEANTLLEERQQYIEEQSEELQSQRDKLLDSNKTKDKLISIIGHDLKNPFGTISGFIELLYLRFDRLTDDKRFFYISTAHDSVKKFKMLLDNILRWAAAQTGKLKINKEYYNLYLMVENVFEILGTTAKSKNIELKNEVSNDIEIYVDENMCMVILQNLITNAIKFTDKGHVAVSLEKGNDAYIINVKDTGIGMGEESVKSLFSSSYTNSKDGTKGEKGTGLGLNLVKDFVELHKGSVWATSELGVGSTFSISFPIRKYSETE